jgi:hypothetical protein
MRRILIALTAAAFAASMAPAVWAQSIDPPAPKADIKPMPAPKKQSTTKSEESNGNKKAEVTTNKSAE